MAFSRPTYTDSSGVSTSGTPITAAFFTDIWDRIDAMVADSVNVTFSAGNFDGNGAQSWTLTSPDQVTFRYQIINKKMTVWFSLESTSVGGTPNTDLQITIPASKVCPVQVNGTFSYVDNGGSITIGQTQINTGQTVIRLIKAAAANWTASTNATSVWGQIEFPIN